MKKKIIKTSITIFAALIGYIILIILINEFTPIRKAMYLPGKTSIYPAIGKDVQLKVNNGKRVVHGLLSQKGEKLVILFHGNAGSINDMEFVTRVFYRNGFSTLLIEYPGYGLSYNQKITEKNIYSDCREIIDHVMQTYDYSIENITLFGWSLGGGVATHMMKENLGSKLIVVSTFSSAPDLAHTRYVKILPYLIMLDRFSNKTKAPGIKEPVLVIHGTKDRFIPHRMGVTLNKLFPDSKLMSIEGADHTNIFRFLDNGKWTEILSFIKK